jgi:tRNA G37 N-methylase TrmD
MRIAVVTLFPEMIRDALAHGVVGRAIEAGVLSASIRAALRTMSIARSMTGHSGAAPEWC